MVLSRTVGATLVLLMAVVPTLSVARADECFADWSVAAPIVKQEGLASVEELSRKGQGKLPGPIVKTVLCREQGAFVYQLIVREPNGQLKRLSVDARHPFEK
jgi:uncharacterized membrane protein YkoI